MPAGFTEGHYVLGVEGLALLRAGAEGRHDEVERRVAELRAVAASLDEGDHAARRDLPSDDAATGYAGWAASYDQPGNDTIAAEEPVVRELLDGLPDGPVLDAACGTGRHLAYLLEAGREGVGVDASEAMLAVARERLPGADLRTGALDNLPVESGSMAGAVCALALSHLPDLGPAVRELARVLRPGGRLIVSNPHPIATGLLGWRAVWVDDDGARRTIPEYPHMASDYVDAFVAAGLAVRRCVEPPLKAAEARDRAKAGAEDAFEAALTGLPAVVVWEAEKPTA